MTNALLVMISCEGKEQAERIGKHLLSKKLAACVQIIPSVDSLFLWPPGEHKVTQVAETLLLVKTFESKWEELEKEVLKNHTYDTPEIIGIPLSHISPGYLEWLTHELS